MYDVRYVYAFESFTQGDGGWANDRCGDKLIEYEGEGTVP